MDSGRGHKEMYEMSDGRQTERKTYGDKERGRAPAGEFSEHVVSRANDGVEDPIGEPLRRGVRRRTEEGSGKFHRSHAHGEAVGAPAGAPLF